MPPFVVEHDSPLTAWGQLRRDLRRRVDEREFLPGAKLPTEAELTEYYGVSRVTVRRAIAAMVDDRYLTTRRGSGTYVALRPLSSALELDLNRPWRQQLVAHGLQAETRLIDSAPSAGVPPEVARFFTAAPPTGSLVFSREIHLVDRVPIGLTESWTVGAPSFASPVESPSPTGDAVIAECFAEIGFATTVQAELLRSYLDIPLIVVHARATLVADGRMVEIARTSWLGNRVRLAYQRSMRLADIDITQLEHRRDAGGAAPSTAALQPATPGAGV